MYDDSSHRCEKKTLLIKMHVWLWKDFSLICRTIKVYLGVDVYSVYDSFMASRPYFTKREKFVRANLLVCILESCAWLMKGYFSHHHTSLYSRPLLANNCCLLGMCDYVIEFSYKDPTFVHNIHQLFGQPTNMKKSTSSPRMLEVSLY